LVVAPFPADPLGELVEALVQVHALAGAQAVAAIGHFALFDLAELGLETPRLGARELAAPHALVDPPVELRLAPVDRHPPAAGVAPVAAAEPVALPVGPLDADLRRQGVEAAVEVVALPA